MKGQAELSGKPPSERRLAGAAQPDQRDAPRAVGRDMTGGAAFDQLGDRGKLRTGMRASRSRTWVIAAARPLRAAAAR